MSSHSRVGLTFSPSVPTQVIYKETMVQVLEEAKKMILEVKGKEKGEAAVLKLQKLWVEKVNTTQFWKPNDLPAFTARPMSEVHEPAPDSAALLLSRRPSAELINQDDDEDKGVSENSTAAAASSSSTTSNVYLPTLASIIATAANAAKVGSSLKRPLRMLPVGTGATLSDSSSSEEDVEGILFSGWDEFQKRRNSSGNEESNTMVMVKRASDALLQRNNKMDNHEPELGEEDDMPELSENLIDQMRQDASLGNDYLITKLTSMSIKNRSSHWTLGMESGILRLHGADYAAICGQGEAIFE